MNKLTLVLASLLALTACDEKQATDIILQSEVAKVAQSPEARKKLDECASVEFRKLLDIASDTEESCIPSLGK